VPSPTPSPTDPMPAGPRTVKRALEPLSSTCEHTQKCPHVRHTYPILPQAYATLMPRLYGNSRFLGLKEIQSARVRVRMCVRGRERGRRKSYRALQSTTQDLRKTPERRLPRNRGKGAATLTPAEGAAPPPASVKRGPHRAQILVQHCDEKDASARDREGQDQHGAHRCHVMRVCAQRLPNSATDLASVRPCSIAPALLSRRACARAGRLRTPLQQLCFCAQRLPNSAAGRAHHMEEIKRLCAFLLHLGVQIGWW